MKARHAVVRLTILMEICKLYVLRNREEKSLRHVAMVAKFLDLNKPCSCKYGRKKTKKKLPSDWPYFPFIVRQCKRPSLARKIVEIRTFCYHGKVTSYLSSLYTLYLMQIPIVSFIIRPNML